MSSGMIGKKLGMTSVFDEAGNQIPCTVIEVAPNVVTQVKTDETDGYNAVQFAYGAKKAKRTTKAMLAHFSAAKTESHRKVCEFRDYEGEVALGDLVRVEEVFEEGEIIDVSGTSKGKGFQGVVKRHGFSGVGMATHGQHNRQRAPGSIGASSYPSRVVKGMRMAGRYGNARVTQKNLQVVRVLPEQNLILVKGAVPGCKTGLVELHKK